MSKIKLFRQSGTPVELESLKAYESEWKVYYDKAAERAGLDMLLLNRFLSFGERQLIKKHGSEVEIELPKTAKAWNELCNKYACPIMAAQRQDGRGLLLVIMDVLQ